MILELFWKICRGIFNTIGFLVPTNSHKLIFSAFGGRKFDDSPRAIYEEMMKMQEFDDWIFVWAFVDPDEIEIPRGRKVKIDTISFFLELLSAKVWISNSGIDRGIGISKKSVIKVETWHGSPLKKIAGEENTNSMIRYMREECKIPDKETIRCAQSEYDKEILARVMHSSKEAFIMSGLPRNDSLFNYSDVDCKRIKRHLNIPFDKKVLLYIPTYREYIVNEKNETFLELPINFKMWKETLKDKYILLVRAHYAVIASMNIEQNDFVLDVSSYPYINDLYAISDIMISDYSSAYFDYSILDRPILCFAYDLDEYMEKRGLYYKLEEILPCRIDKTENELLDSIKHIDPEESSREVRRFHNKFNVYDKGYASISVINAIKEKL